MSEVDGTRVVLVDDDPSMVEVWKLVLSTDSSFTTVGSAASGEEAIRILATTRVDVVLLDYRLPGLNGLETARVIKEKHPDVRVIMLTAYDEDEGEFSNADNLAQIDAIITKRRFSVERLKSALGIT